MADNTRSNDDVTGKQLRLFIGLVVVLGGGTLLWSIATLWATRTQPPNILTTIAVTGAIALAHRTFVVVRIRSNQRRISWTEVGVLVGLTLLPVAWVIVCTTVAIAVSRASTRPPILKLVFGIGKETLVAATAGAVFLMAGYDRHTPALKVLGTIAVAALAMGMVDELLVALVMALATHTRVGHVLRADWVVRVLALLARYVVSIMIIGILLLDGDIRLLLAVPPVVLCLHLWQAGHLRSRAERQSWQRLAQTTDELNVVDLSSVLRTAVVRAAELFSFDGAEVELGGYQGGRLVRGAADGVAYDGTVADSASRQGSVIVTALSGHDGSDPLGVLRICSRGPIKLTESEQYKLKTFASALYTAIRNAIAYAELERISQTNAHEAVHDSLTGLANRRALLEHCATVLSRPHDGMAALLLLDLNHFKEVNDTLGHTAGDQVLVEVARRLQEAARPDDLVARLGGDEFAVLLTDLPAPAVATHRADSLLGCLEETIEVDGMRLTVQASGGIALAPGSGGVTELLRRADVAMYQAKRSGRRTIAYVHARDTADISLLLLSGELTRAVADDEFIVDFQPIVDLSTGEVVSAEALARWYHPHHGDLNPLRFLETVERSGQLPAFADAVLARSLEAVESWRAAGFDIPVAVNVSPRSLLDPHFPAAVLDRLATAAVPADRLVLEVTETLTLSQLEVVERALTDLRAAGVRLTLDHFGTGASSLSVLSRIPVHELKVHQRFVTAVETSPEAAAVIRSTVDLGRSLRLSVTADGVQSEPQRHALWELGCVAGQGHLFARPMPPARLLAVLRRGAAGRPGALAPALHDAGAVVRLSRRGRAAGRGGSALPHWPA